MASETSPTLATALTPSAETASAAVTSLDGTNEFLAEFGEIESITPAEHPYAPPFGVPITVSVFGWALVLTALWVGFGLGSLPTAVTLAVLAFPVLVTAFILAQFAAEPPSSELLQAEAAADDINNSDTTPADTMPVAKQ